MTWHETVTPMIPRQHCDFLVAACDHAGGIYSFSVSEDGTVSQRGFYPVDRPMYMAVQGKSLYVLLRAPFADSADSGLIRFDLGEDLALKDPSDIVSTNGEVACHLCVRGKEVYCANYISGSVTAIGKKTVLHEGHSVNPKRQASPHTHFVTVTPDDKYLCVADLGLDKVFRYDLSLQYLDSFSLPAGSGPRHLAFSDDGAYCFVVSELASTVTSFAYADGRFERIDTVSCLPKGYAGESTAAAIRYFDGKIYASNRGHDSIAVIEQKQGKLTLSGIYSACGSSPRDFIVSEEYILVANEQSHAVNLFDRQMHPLTAVTGIPSPVCVLML